MRLQPGDVVVDLDRLGPRVARLVGCVVETFELDGKPATVTAHVAVLEDLAARWMVEHSRSRARPVPAPPPRMRTTEDDRREAAERCIRREIQPHTLSELGRKPGGE